MKGGLFQSIYVWILVILLLISLPIAVGLKSQDEKNLIESRANLEKQQAMYVLFDVVSAGHQNPLVLMDNIRKSLQTVNAKQKDFQIIHGALYDLSSRSPDGARLTYQLQEKYAGNPLDVPPPQYTASGEQIRGMSRTAQPVSLYWIPLPSPASPHQLVMVGAKDMRVKNILEENSLRFWMAFAGIFILVYILVMTGIQLVVKRPMARLQAILMADTESVGRISPEEFGDLGDLVQALLTYVDRTRTAMSTVANIDPVTGLLSGSPAVSAYVENQRASGETYAFFFRANFAKEYVKICGRSFRDKILKLTASTVAQALPPGVRLYAVQDHFLMVLLTETQFNQCFSLIHRFFARAVAPLYEKEEARKIQPMTLSAVGISNQSAGYEAFHDVLQRIHEEWDNLVNRQIGGFALMNSEDQWVKGVPDEAPPEEDIVPEEPEALKDPIFARKLFIVKLAFMFQFEPQKASKLYQIGFTRLPMLLEENALVQARKHGLEPDLDALVRKMRVIPKRRLYYSDSDFRQVFVTDIRLIRKIPREIITRWFSAGFRQLSDLADMDPGDLLKIDPTAGIDDIRAIVQQANALRAAPRKAEP